MNIPIPNLESYYLGNRLYHNWQHILNVRNVTGHLLQKMDVRPLEERLISIGGAMAYHDVFQGKNHEAASAVKCLLETHDVFAARLIMEATTHFGTPGIDELGKLLPGDFEWEAEENDGKIVAAIHDADLWGFSEDEVTFRKNNDNLVFESIILHQVHPKDMLEGRARFFQSVVDQAKMGTFYHTSVAKERHDIVIKNVTQALKFIQ